MVPILILCALLKFLVDKGVLGFCLSNKITGHHSLYIDVGIFCSSLKRAM